MNIHKAVLWEQVNSGIKPTIQCTDIETINIILNTNIYTQKIILHDDELLLIKKYIPTQDNYLNKDCYSSIHGIMHTTRVMFYSLLISKVLGINYELPIFIASIHDISRNNDNGDLEHGKRAAEYFASNINTLYKEFLYQKELIYFCLENHNLSQQVPDVLDTKYLYLSILKTADALDRFRLPKIKWWPDANI